LDSYFGSCFQELCKEALPLIYKKEKAAADFEIGEYWDKQTQIDVVGFRQDNYIDIGECKWGEVSSLPHLVQEIQKKMQLFPNPKNATLQGRIFSRKKIRSRLNLPFKIHTLEDLYNLKKS
jgi:AAA+ ATPase superfamily predicted ATPase